MLNRKISLDLYSILVKMWQTKYIVMWLMYTPVPIILLSRSESCCGFEAVEDISFLVGVVTEKVE